MLKRLLAVLAAACGMVGGVSAQSGGGGTGEGGGLTPYVQMEQAWFTYAVGNGGATVYASSGGGDTIDFDGDGNIATCVSNGFQGYASGYHAAGTDGWKSAKQVKIEYHQSNGGAVREATAEVLGNGGFWYEQSVTVGVNGQIGYFTEVRLTLQQMRTVNGVDVWVSLSAQEIYTYDY